MAWCDVADVESALGIPVTNPDHLAACVDAANAFCVRRRTLAGYVDDPVVAPGPDAHLAAVTYAVALYRERGTVDSFASFDELAAGNLLPAATFGQVLRLLAVPRPAIDRPRTADELVARWHLRRLADRSRLVW